MKTVVKQINSIRTTVKNVDIILYVALKPLLPIEPGFFSSNFQTN